MAELIWSSKAIRDLDEVCEYIGRNSEQYAKAFALRVFGVADSIRRMPMLGAEVWEYRDPEIRERLCGKHRVIYRIRDQTAEILMVYHGARLLPESLN